MLLWNASRLVDENSGAGLVQMNSLTNAKILLLERKVRFAEKVAADIGKCIDELIGTPTSSEVRDALVFYRGTANAVHLLLESMFCDSCEPKSDQPMDELCRIVKT